MNQIVIEDNKDGKDAKFIESLINSLFKNPPKFEIITSRGYANIKSIETTLRDKSDNGDNILFIFDADYSKQKNGGTKKRREYLERELNKFKINYCLFLLPNNSDDGTFEHLYENIINPKNKDIFECLSKYESCINKLVDEKGNQKYKSLNQKARIYTYIESQNLSKKDSENFKGKNYLFDNPKYWNLNCEAIKPLRDFLKNNLK